MFFHELAEHGVTVPRERRVYLGEDKPIAPEQPAGEGERGPRNDP
jgi:hypothetical protein